jgi:hypothetical protein
MRINFSSNIAAIANGKLELLHKMYGFYLLHTHAQQNVKNYFICFIVISRLQCWSC